MNSFNNFTETVQQDNQQFAVQNNWGNPVIANSSYMNYNNPVNYNRDVLDIINGNQSSRNITRLTVTDRFKETEGEVKGNCGCGGRCGDKGKPNNEKQIDDESFFSESDKELLLNSVQDTLKRFPDFREYDNYLKRNNARVWIQENLLMMKIGRPENVMNAYYSVPEKQRASMTFHVEPTRIFETKSYIESDGGLRTKIVDQRNNTDILNIRFNRVNDEWIPDANPNLFPKTDEKLPIDASLDMINLQTTAIWIGMQFVIGKKLQIKQKVYKKNIIRKGKKAKTQDKAPDGYEDRDKLTCTINHDLYCSFSGPLIPPLYLYNKSIQIIWPGIGTIKVNAESCCKEHDITLWCTSGYWDAYIADIALVSCWFKKIFNEALKLCPERFLCIITLGSPLVVLNLFLLSVFGFLVTAVFSWLPDGGEEYRNIEGKNSNCCLCNDKDYLVTKDLQGKRLCGKYPWEY